MILQEGSQNKRLEFEYLDAPEHFKPLALRLKTRIKQQLNFLNVEVEVVNELTLPEDAEWKLI
jgi:hypothetical protein